MGQKHGFLMVSRFTPVKKGVNPILIRYESRKPRFHFFAAGSPFYTGPDVWGEAAKFVARSPAIEGMPRPSRCRLPSLAHGSVGLK